MISSQDKHRWETVGRIEINLRRLVADVLTERLGSRAWDEGVPKGTRDRISERAVDQHRSLDQVPELEERLHLCDLGGLYEIIDLHWKMAFQSLLAPDRAMWDMQSDVIKRTRNSLDHYRREILPTGEEDRSLRPIFDMVGPLQLRAVAIALAKRGLTWLEPAPEDAAPIEREDPPALERRDYVHFVGRGGEVGQLVRFLSEEVPVIVVHGIGGVGKTATCIEVGRRAYKAGLFDEVVYAPVRRGYLLREQAAVSVAPFESFEGFLRLVTNSLGSSLPAGVDIDELERRVLELIAEEKTLIIVDNFETLREQSQLADFFWRVPGGTKALVTTRIPPATGGRFFQLDELPKEEIGEIIRNECILKGKSRLVEVDREDVLDRIYAAIGGIPLAAKLLVGAMATRWQSLDTVLDELVKVDRNRLVDFCFARIYGEMLSDDARLVLKAFGVFGREASHSDIEVATELPPVKLADSLMALEMTSLLGRQAGASGEDTYRVLPLTWIFAKQKLLESPGLETVIRKRLEARHGGQPSLKPSVLEALKLANEARLKLRQDKVDEALERSRKAIEIDDGVPMVYLVYGMVEEKRGNLEEAERILTDGFRRFPSDAKIAHKLAVVKSRLGKFQEAADLYRSILVLAPSTESEMQQTEYTLGGLAENYRRWLFALRERHAFREVRARAQEFMRLIDSDLKFPGPLPRETLLRVSQIRQTLGIQLTIAGEYQQAEECLLQSLVESVSNPQEMRHNDMVLDNLHHNLEKWRPKDATERAQRYGRRVQLLSGEEEH